MRKPLYLLHARPQELLGYEKRHQVPMVALWNARPHQGKRSDLENYIIKDPLTAVEYSKKVIYRPWLEAESVILSNPEAAVRYLTHWKNFKAVQQTLRDKRLQAEPYIIQDPYWASEYADKVIERPWPAAESTIMQDPLSASNYSINVMQQPWSAAHDTIRKDRKIWNDYLEYWSDLGYLTDVE